MVCGLVVLAGCGGSSNSSSTPTAKAPVANAGGPYTGTAGTAGSERGVFEGSAGRGVDISTSNFGDNGTGTGVSPTHTYAAAGRYCVTLTVTNTSNLTATPTSTGRSSNGRVYGGLQPIAGAHVYLFAANTTRGMGKLAVPLLQLQHQRALLIALRSWLCFDGCREISCGLGTYTCTPGTQVYLYALGSNSGSEDSAAGSVGRARIPRLREISQRFQSITVNEVSTITGTYAFADCNQCDAGAQVGRWSGVRCQCVCQRGELGAY